MTYETDVSAVACAAWETWTKNGLNLDADEREQTNHSALDAANNAYHANISQEQWLAQTLKLLGHKAD